MMVKQPKYNFRANVLKCLLGRINLYLQTIMWMNSWSDYIKLHYLYSPNRALMSRAVLYTMIAAGLVPANYSSYLCPMAFCRCAQHSQMEVSCLQEDICQ